MAAKRVEHIRNLPFLVGLGAHLVVRDCYSLDLEFANQEKSFVEIHKRFAIF